MGNILQKTVQRLEEALRVMRSAASKISDLAFEPIKRDLATLRSDLYKLQGDLNTITASESVAEDLQSAKDVCIGHFMLYTVMGDDARLAANMQDEESPDWTELEHDPSAFSFNTKLERAAFMQGIEATKGYTDWYSMPESEYVDCCEARGIPVLKPCQQKPGTSCQDCDFCTVELPKNKPYLAIHLEGGLVQCVISNRPKFFEGIDVLVYDYDTDGADEDKMMDIIYEHITKRAVGHIESIIKSGIDIEASIGGMR